MSRRWRYPRTRRGTFSGVIPAQTPGAPPAYTPAFAEPSGRNARLAGTRTRRGRFLAVARAVCPPPVRPAHRSTRLGAVRRGAFYLVPAAPAVLVAPWIPSALDSRRPSGRSVHRGQFFRGSLTSAAPTMAFWVPAAVDPRRPVVRPARCGRFFVVPLVGSSPAPPIVLPLRTQGRARLMAARRGRSWSPPLIQQVVAPPWVPSFGRRARPKFGLVRRGEYVPVVLSPTVCPSRVGPRRPTPALRRRTSGCGMPWTRESAARGGLSRMPSQRATPRPTRRGVFAEPPWIGAALVPYVAPEEVEATPRPYVSGGTAQTMESTATARIYVSTATARSTE